MYKKSKSHIASAVSPIKSTCRQCDESFNPIRKGQIFCSRRCADKSKLEKDRVIPISGNCYLCGREFESSYIKRRFCSAQCYDMYTKTPEAKAIAKSKKVASKTSTPENYFRALLQNKNRTKLTGFRLSAEELMQIWEDQLGRCAITNRKMTMIAGHGYVATNVSIDRIIAGGCYAKSNVRLVCREANSMRRNMSDDELLGWASDIVSTLGNSNAVASENTRPHPDTAISRWNWGED